MLGQLRVDRIDFSLLIYNASSANPDVTLEINKSLDLLERVSMIIDDNKIYEATGNNVLARCVYLIS